MSSLQIFNTLSAQKERFEAQNHPVVSFYACGVTVYDHCHIGHARAYVAFDVARRHLEALGFKVNYVQNFTDIDDKIIARAAELGESVEVLTTRFIASYHEDMDQLNILRATAYPLATQSIADMQALISTLLADGVAYEAGGDVCFDVSKFPSYGKLSKKVLDELEAGSRVAVSDQKRNPFDFVLWKKAKPGEPAWPSPWGEGRPGWHIECSAMAMKALGETLDIHAGGEDLVFPHHENEIAQSECVTHKPFARYWLHNGFVTIKNQKMSKSEKNFFTIKEILNQFPGDVLRFFLLKSHYRTPLAFSTEGLQEAQVALTKLKTAVEKYPEEIPVNHPEKAKAEGLAQRFVDAMNDDFNTAEALGYLFDLSHLVNAHQFGGALLRRLGDRLGIFYRPLETQTASAEALAVLETRWQAKQNRDFKTADALRGTLLDQFGIVVEDAKDGYTWKYTTPS
ncbi:MAG: cysteine--tRNA ligase [Candidatus Margulisiibacteriota bacterium]